MTNKERYIQWASEQEYLPLTMQPWWMDAVCAGKEWNVLLAVDKEDNILAALPYLIRKRAWLRYIVMPQQTQIGGIWVAPSVTEDKWQTAEVCRQMVEQLDALKLAYYYQQYPVNSLCVEPMRALGFKTRERITYRIDDLSNLDDVIDGFSKNKKRQLQKALSLHAERSMSPEEFYRFHSRCMAEQHKRITYSREFFLVLERKARRLGQSEIISIHNADGEIYAAAFLVWDKRLMYYLIPCYALAHKNTGAGALLVLESIKLARKKQVIFDFEGSMIRGVANHYRQFGSTPVKYYSVEKYYRPLFRLATFFNKLRNIRYNAF
ncbi:MAG: GNAT family N-acetyltransferase [Paludibacteraceae bacterium]